MNALDVNETRKRLISALGESSKSYFAHLKSWFCMKTNKEEFDRQARLFLPPHLVHLHNEFLLAVLTKCQSLCQPTTYVYEGIKQRPTVFAPTKKCVKPERISSIEIKPVTIARTIEPKNKPTKVNFENRFQPVDPVSQLPVSSHFPLEKSHIRFCSRDLTLPDAALVHGRMLVAAWDAGLDDGCEDKAIKLILTATKQFLKQLMVAIISNRKGYRLRENRVVQSVGLPTLNPWLHNSWHTHDSTTNSHSPDDPSTYQGTCKAERDSAYYIACTADENEFLKPISVLDVFQTLQVQKSVLPCHSIYAVNMERISQRLYHPDL